MPAGGAIRFVTRFAYILLIPASFGVAVLLDRVRMRTALVLGAIVVLEQMGFGYSIDKLEYRERVQRAAAAVDPQCERIYLDAGENLPAVKTLAAWVYLETGVPSANGFSDIAPIGWTPPIDGSCIVRMPAS
jgi:hypothetical protein